MKEQDVGKNWIQSFSGQKICPAELDPSTVRLDDIAHALAQKCRFNGHAKLPLYSVAEHCVRGYDQLSYPHSFAYLLHEVSEVYLPDIPSPIKPMLFITDGVGFPASWSDLEAAHTELILEALKLKALLPLMNSPEVKRMDLAMLAAEKDHLMGESPDDWGLTVEPAFWADRCVWNPQTAKNEWMEAFTECLLQWHEGGHAY